MNDTATKAKREYMRKWRAENQDKVKAHQQRFWERKAAEMAKKEDDSNGGNEHNPRDCQKS